MPDWNRAWTTGAPPDYVLLFDEESQGQHAIVHARFKTEDEAVGAGRGLEGAELASRRLRVYCTLPGEARRVSSQLRGLARKVWIEPGRIEFLAVGGRTPETPWEPPRTRRTTRVVMSLSGDRPRHYLFEDQCPRCGELLGRIHVMPTEAVLIDTRRLVCRCEGIPCRYCKSGSVRRPLSEHLDPERRCGHMPWFGFLVPCGGCQANSRGPRVVMSS